MIADRRSSSIRFDLSFFTNFNCDKSLSVPAVVTNTVSDISDISDIKNNFFRFGNSVEATKNSLRLEWVHFCFFCVRHYLFAETKEDCVKKDPCCGVKKPAAGAAGGPGRPEAAKNFGVFVKD